MKSVRLVAMSAACLFLMSCNESFTGILRLQQPIVLRAKKADVQLPAGDHNVKIKASSSKVKLEMKINGKEEKVEFALPKGTKIRSFNDVNIAPGASGQAYGLKGYQQTTSSRGSTQRGTESCTYYVSERVCRDVKQPDDTTKYECFYEDVAKSGDQDVEYYETDYTTDRAIQVLDPSTLQEIGRFANRTYDSETTYTYRGDCRRNWSSW